MTAVANPRLGLLAHLTGRPALLLALCCALAQPMVAVATEGALLVYRFSAREADTWLVELGAAQGGAVHEWALPRSRISQAHTEKIDRWQTGAGSDTLVRVDGGENVDLFQRKTHERSGGFALDRLPRVDQPSLAGPLKPSPDGRYLLSYWRANYRAEQPVLVVFDRTGRVLNSGSARHYDQAAHSSAFDWLPDGKLIYLADHRLALQLPGERDLKVAPPIAFARNTSTDGATLRVSPDGQRLLWTLATTLKNASGSELVHHLLYVSNLDGSAMRQLTTLTPRAQGDLISWSHRAATWSPDGKWVVFLAGTRSAYGALPYPGGRCAQRLVVPASAESVAIDGTRDPPGLQAAAPGHPPALAKLQACDDLKAWLR